MPPALPSAQMGSARSGKTAERLCRLLVCSTVLLSMAIAVYGCGDEDGLRGQMLPNTPPETTITAIPLASDRADYHTSFRWRGFDKEDEVVGFEWRISNNGADGAVDPPDTLEANCPWHYTARTDTTITVSADLDSFQIDVGDETLGPYDIRFWQTHTLFVRAIDDRGSKDPSPAHASFTATTVAPVITIDYPNWSPTVTCNGAAQVLTFGWTGYDLDSESERPTHVRYLLMPWENAEGGCFTEAEYEQIQPIRSDDPGWTDWIPYDAPADSGRIVRYLRHPVGRSYLFVVQALDEAGAVTPVFEWGRNVRHVEVRDDKIPVVVLNEQHLGQRVGVGPNNLYTEEIVGGQPIEFAWVALAEDYGGYIEGYRYGWNVADPEDPNDPGWAVPWGPAWRRAPRRSFTEGSPNFVVQARDNSGSLSRVMYQFQVIAIAERANQRNLLLVDDWPFGDSPDEQNIELDWDRRWMNLLMGRVLGFQNRDILDTYEEFNRMGFSTANGYKSIVWFVGPSTLSYLHDELAPIRDWWFWGNVSGSFRPFNWLEIYMQRVGNVLLVGPGAMLSSVERDPPYWLYPIIFNTPQGGSLGFGLESLPDGSTVNGGVQRFPYTAMCLEAIDIVRPSPTDIYGESAGYTRQKRTLVCDGLNRAEVSSLFLDAYPDARNVVQDLLPTEERLEQTPTFRLQFEEFYNANVTSRDISLTLRDCQVPMFVHRAHRDEGNVEDPYENCIPALREISSLDGVVVGVASSAYSESKQLRGSEDFIWGFHPLAFEPRRVQNALLWVINNRWEVPVRW